MVELACLAGTLAAYGLALGLRRLVRSPVANPTLVAVLAVGAVLGLTGLDYESYEEATAPISFLLGPAVVALAVPLHCEREWILEHARALLLGAVLGAGAAMLLGFAAARLLALNDDFALALTTRTATTPISIAIADGLDGAPALSAVLSITSGIFGATFGSAVLDRVGVTLPGARGVAVGLTAHGIGTERMLDESRVAGASSSVGMGLGGLAVALVVPGLWGS